MLSIQLARRLPTCSRRTFASAAVGARPAEQDITIIGGGPAGLALLASLARSPVTAHLRTTLVEAGDLAKVEHWNETEGVWTNRVSSVTNENRRFLEEIGSWKHVNAARTGPIEEMQVWDSASMSSPRLTLTSPSVSGMSTLLENLNLQRSLLRLHSELAPSLPNSTVRAGVKVESIDLLNGPADYPTLALSNGERLRTRLLIGADGPRSPVRAFAGIGSTGHSYQTKTIVSCISHTPYAPFPHGPRRTAYQRFLPTGPLAFLPMGETQGSLAWHLRDWEMSDAVRTLPEDSLVLLINACFRLPEHAIQHLLGRVLARYRASPPGAPATEAKPTPAAGTSATAPLFPEPALDHAELLASIEMLERSSSILPHSALSSVTPPSHLGVPPKDAHLVPPQIQTLQPGTTASFPLFYSHAERYIAPRVALVGDAAHTVHPHAGMGLNMGLHDGRMLMRAIERAVEVGGDLGSEGSLKPYEKEAWARNQAVLTSTDSLERMYRWDNPLVKWVRGTGVEVLEELPGIKDMLIRQSGGTPMHELRSPPPPRTLADGIAQAAHVAEGVKGLAQGLTGLVGRGLRGAVKGAVEAVVSGKR